MSSIITAINWNGFIGHFHPLVLHIPIGLAVGLLLLESLRLLLKRRGRDVTTLDSACTLTAAALAASAAAAAITGYLWRLDAFAAAKPDLILHQQLGFAVSIACAVAALSRLPWQLQSKKAWAALYALSFTAALVLMTLTGHLGGQLVHGKHFLSEDAPQILKPFLGPASPPPQSPDPDTPPNTPPATPQSFYKASVAPILSKYCVECHGPDKHKGSLRLDTPELIMKGGNEGLAVVPGKPEESLLVTLCESADEDEHMPPLKKPQPSPEQIKLLRDWVQNGASFTAP